MLCCNRRPGAYQLEFVLLQLVMLEPFMARENLLQATATVQRTGLKL